MRELKASRAFYVGDTKVSRLGTGKTRPIVWSFTKRGDSWDVVMQGGGRCATLRLDDDAFAALLETAHAAFATRQDCGPFEDFP